MSNVPLAWSGDWAWGLPLIVFTVLIHAVGFGLISRKTLNASSHTIRRHPVSGFVVVIGLTTPLATNLHAIEATIWAIACRFLGALPNNRSAILYSLNAMTSYGHINLNLEEHMAISQWFKVHAIRVGFTVVAAVLLCFPICPIFTLPRA